MPREPSQPSERRPAVAAQRLLAAEEAERRRISRELHDEVGQLITVALLQVDHAALGPPHEALARLHAVRATLEAAQDSVRGIARRVRPQALDDLGLANALLALAASFDVAARTVVRADIARGALRGLEPESELALYRIAQEACTNAVRHSGARTVSIAVTRDDARVVLTVSDDGTGFEVADGPGSGIPGMVERAAAAGGELKLSSGAGRGTRLVASLPARMGVHPHSAPSPQRAD